MKNKHNKIWLTPRQKTFKSEFIFSTSLFIISILSLLFFAIFALTGSFNEEKESIDFRILMDAQYLTLWTAWVTIVYYGIKMYNSIIKKDTISSGFEIMIISLLILTGFIYDLYMTALKSWPIHQPFLMIRTIVEHVINPIALLTYTLIYVNPKYIGVKKKQIFIDSVRIIVFVTVYFVWITIRSVSWVMVEEGHDPTALQFPYSGFSPQDIGWSLYMFGVILFIGISWGFYIGIYFAIKKQTFNVIEKYSNKKNNDNSKNEKQMLN